MFTSMTAWCHMCLRKTTKTFITHKVFFMQNIAYGKWNFKHLPQQEELVRSLAIIPKPYATTENKEDSEWFMVPRMHSKQLNQIRCQKNITTAIPMALTRTSIHFRQ